MEEYNYLEADKEAVIKVLDDFKESDGKVDYSKAMKNLIQ